MRRSRLLRAGRRPTRLLALPLLMLCLTACDKAAPPVVSGDLSCERFRHISATEEQIGLIRQYWSVMESWARQVFAHNQEYDKDCLKPPEPAKKFGGPK